MFPMELLCARALVVSGVAVLVELVAADLGRVRVDLGVCVVAVFVCHGLMR
jgi:hypothetical protein